MTQVDQPIDRVTLNGELIRYRRTHGAAAFSALLKRLGVERPQDIEPSEFAKAVSESRAIDGNVQHAAQGVLQAKFASIAATSPNMPTAFDRFAKAFYERKAK